jgi:hypothetical protein
LKSSRKNKKKQLDHALGRTFGRSASLRWKTFKLIPNLQTIKPKSITINQKSSLSALPANPPYPYRLRQGEIEEEMSTKQDTEEQDEKERERERSLP